MIAKRYPQRFHADGYQARLEAIWFAKAFLMPSRAFRADCQDTRTPIPVEGLFDVPPRVVMLRHRYLESVTAAA